MESKFDVEKVMQQIREDIIAKGINKERLSYKSFYYYKSVDFFRKQKQIIIFGVGEYGRLLYDELISNGIDSVVGFCDNNESVIGSQMKGYDILKPVAAVNMYSEACFVITPDKYENEIIVQLLELGVPIGQIRNFNVKTSGLE